MKKIRILYYIDYIDSIGGGATQSISSLKNILTVMSDHENILCFRNLDFYGKLRSSSEFQNSKNFKVLKHKNSNLDFIKHFLRHMSNYRIILPSSLDKLTKRNQIDYVIFLTPSHKVDYLTATKFVYSIWDLCHLTNNQWPEMRNRYYDIKLEKLLENNLRRASLILVDSDSNKRVIHKRYNIENTKIINFPFDSLNLIDETLSKNENKSSLIGDNKYFIYPASFWPHKNHTKLIKAFGKFTEKNKDFKLVLTGKDEGQKNTIVNLISELNLNDKVIIFDHLNHRDFTEIFKYSHALVYPSFFGPTNIPPIEAWKLEVPVACSNIMIDQIGDAGKLFDPGNEAEITESLHFMCEENNRAFLIKKGKEQLAVLDQIRNRSLKEIKDKLETEANL